MLSNIMSTNLTAKTSTLENVWNMELNVLNTAQKEDLLHMSIQKGSLNRILLLMLLWFSIWFSSYM